MNPDNQAAVQINPSPAYGIGSPVGNMPERVSSAARIAAEAWAAAMLHRERPGRMSPMDEMAWFQEPKLSEIVLGNAVTTPVQICSGDPMRVRLLVSVHNIVTLTTGGVTLYDWVAVSTQDKLINGCLIGGIILSLGCCNYLIDDEHFPGMVQKPWYTFYYGISGGSGNAALHVTEIRLKAWPRSC